MKAEMSSVATKVTPEEYLERERAAEFKSEYRDGVIVAMSGASRRHNRIVTNLVSALDRLIGDAPCNVYSNALRLASGPRRLFTYPDVIVACGDEQYVDEQFDTLVNPMVIIEVLSESTEKYDRGEKFTGYKTLPSLMEYLLVSQDEVRIEQWTRRANDQWLWTEYRDPSANIRLECVGVSLPVHQVYRKLELRRAR
jgi:Uma2 family endonuclease